MHSIVINFTYFSFLNFFDFGLTSGFYLPSILGLPTIHTEVVLVTIHGVVETSEVVRLII